MVSIKIIADGLSKQIESAIAGKVNVEQADVLCKSVDSLIKLAKLQMEMGQFDWGTSDERPVIEMEKTVVKESLTTDGAKPNPVNKTGDTQPPVKTPPLNQNLQKIEKLNQPSLNERLMAWLYQRNEPFGIGKLVAELKCELSDVNHHISYWASKGHLEKIGTGALASYRVIDREFFQED